MKKILTLKIHIRLLRIKTFMLDNSKTYKIWTTWIVLTTEKSMKVMKKDKVEDEETVIENLQKGMNQMMK